MSSRSTTAGRNSSMIIHDIDEEDQEPAQPSAEESQEESVPEEQPPPPPPPRTRKAKETQFRLGVGRPLAAGGRGPRAVTKSVSVSKSKKGKSATKGAKPSEDTIVEEEEKNESESEPNTRREPSADANKEPSPSTLPSNPSTSSDIDARVVEALKPLHQQLRTLKAELDQMQVLKNELSEMRSQVSDIQIWKQRVETLTNELKDLREKAALVDSLNTELQQLKESIQRTSTPMSEEAASGFRTPTTSRPPVSNALSIPRAPALVTGPSAASSYSSHPGLAPILLGKRHRDSTASNVTGVVDEDQESGLSEADLAKTVLRPNKKRPKLTGDADDANEERESQPTSEENDDVSRAGPSFTVFSGPEPDDSYIDPPPPTTPLPSFYSARTPPNNGAGPSRHRVTSTQNAAENVAPFSFDFLPVPPTPGPGNPYSMPAFPYPEPPQSPTPARDHNSGGSMINHRDRTDMFQAFGLPPPIRPRSHLEPTLRSQEAEMGAFINPAALDNRDPTDGNEGPTRSDNSADAIKRTMYGTELEGDTRFGDFGLEGVATDFNWTGQF
ncbi:hypothetical protein GYMLUDRAFT_33288 [Collybiopsis luxurians FD-317 M1]|nr:hypothetical protein GYMLUDRAFT_33288 [Collybiopsis luxurians FD-317 M1]